EIWIDTETADWNTKSPRLSLVQLRLAYRVGSRRPVCRPPPGNSFDLGHGAPADDDRQRRRGHVLRRLNTSAAVITSPRSTLSIASSSSASCSLDNEKDSSGLSAMTVTVVPSISGTSPSRTILPS